MRYFIVISRGFVPHTDDNHSKRRRVLKKTILLGGYGGQGVQTLGRLLAVAFSEAGKQVAFVPDYSGSMRGGISNCSLIISDQPIGSPLLKDPDILIALNEGAKRAFENRIVPGGMLIYNTDIAKSPSEREDILAAGLPANTLAEQCGSAKAANVVILAFFTRLSGMLPVEAMKKTVERELNAAKPFWEDLNQRAFVAGIEAAEKSLRQTVFEPQQFGR